MKQTKLQQLELNLYASVIAPLKGMESRGATIDKGDHRITVNLYQEAPQSPLRYQYDRIQHKKHARTLVCVELRQAIRNHVYIHSMIDKHAVYIYHYAPEQPYLRLLGRTLEDLFQRELKQRLEYVTTEPPLPSDTKLTNNNRIAINHKQEVKI